MKSKFALISLISFSFILVGCPDDGELPVLGGPYLNQIPPSMTPEIFAPGIVNTEDKNHSSVTTSPDGKEIYWSLFSVIDNVRQERIWVTKIENRKWTFPRVAVFSGEYRDGQPVFSTNGKRLYFSSLRPIHPEDDRTDANIWFVQKTDTGWSQPVYLDSTVNSEHQEWFPSVARSGNIYYALYRKDRNTSWDIYCTKFHNGKYNVPERMSDSINSPFVDGTPYIDPDERFLIFFSERPTGRFEDAKLYISFRVDNDSWTQAKLLDKRINSSASRFPNMSPDGRYFFFTNMQSGTEDVYWVDAKLINNLIEKD